MQEGGKKGEHGESADAFARGDGPRQRERTSKLCVTLLQIAHLLHELLDGHILVVGRQVRLRRNEEAQRVSSCASTRGMNR